MSSYNFDGVNKIITPAGPPVGGAINNDVQDMYSRWVDWFLTVDNSKYYLAMKVINPWVGDKSLGSTYFMLNGWKIRPYEATHVFNLVGNLYSEDGSSPFVPTIGEYNVTIINTVSNLIDSPPEPQYAKIAYSVWDKSLSELTQSNTIGNFIKKKVLTTAKFIMKN